MCHAVYSDVKVLLLEPHASFGMPCCKINIVLLHTYSKNY